MRKQAMEREGTTPEADWKKYLSHFERACSGWPLWLVLAGIFHLLYFAHSPSLGGPFIYDDHKGIIDNPDLRGGFELSRFFGDHETSLYFDRRPVTGITAWLDFQLYGLRPFGFKLTNLILHLSVSCVAFALIRRLATRFGCALPSMFAVACVSIWTVHPLLTNAVSFVFQRSEILMSLFFVSALLCLDLAVDGKRRRFWAGAFMVCAVLSVLSKEIGLTILVVAPIIERVAYFETWRDFFRWRWPRYLALASIFAVLVVWISSGIRMTELGSAGVFWDPPLGYMKFQISALAKYIRLLAWPHPMIFVSYPTGWENPAKWIPSLFFLLVIGGLIVRWAVRFPWLWLCTAVFLGVLAPTTSILPIPLEPYAEFRMYLPSLAAIVAAVGLVTKLIGWWSRASGATLLRWVWIPALLACFAATATTRYRNRLFATPSGIWEDIFTQEPTNGRALTNLGIAYLQERNLPGASACARRLVEEGLATNHQTLVRVGRRIGALVELEDGRVDVALPILREIAATEPSTESAQVEFALALVRAGDVRLAREVFDERIRGRFISPTVQALEAELLIEEENLKEASRVIGRLSEIIPRNRRIEELRDKLEMAGKASLESAAAGEDLLRTAPPAEDTGPAEVPRGSN